MRRNLPLLTTLPDRGTPAAVFISVSKDGRRACDALRELKAVFGEEHCLLGSQACQLLALEPGIPETFVYGPHERTFRIELLKLHLIATSPRLRRSASQERHRCAGHRALGARAYGSAQVQVELPPGQHPHDSSEGQKRAEGDRHLAGPRPVASDQNQADDAAHQQRDEDRRCHRPAEKEAHRRGKLDVAQPHPFRVGERHQEQQAARRGSSDRPLGEPTWVGRGRSPGKAPRPRAGPCWG